MLSPDAAIENKLQTHFVNIEYRSNEFQFAFTTGRFTLDRITEHIQRLRISTFPVARLEILT